MEIFRPIPVVPSGPGGPAVISDMEGEKTFILTGGSTDDVIELEVSGNGTNWGDVPNGKFSGPDTRTLRVHGQFIRTNHTKGGGTMVMQVNAQQSAGGSAGLGMQEFEYRGDNLAADVLAESPIFTVVGNRTLSKIYLVSAGALAQDAVDFFTFTYRARDATGALIGVIGVFSTSTTPLVAQTSGANLVGLTITDLPDGTIVTFQAEKGGAGQLLPITSHTFAYG